MGESRNLFNIPAYLKVEDKRFRVIKWGTNGLKIENSPEIKPGETITGDFIFPYDAYNELVIPEIKLKCQSEEDGTLFCMFDSLSKDKEKILKFLIREYLWRRIISIPSEFMNYTQDSEVRKELMLFQRNIYLKQKLKKTALFLGSILIGGCIFFGTKLLFQPKPPVLTIKYSEISKNKKATQENSSKETEKLEESTEKVKNLQVKEATAQTKTSDRKEEKKADISQEKITINENQLSSELQEKKVAATTKKIKLKSSTDAGGKEKKKETLSRKIDYYCVQVATDSSSQKLIRLAQKLKNFPYVRVEKIGNFYTLRVGFEKSYKKNKKLAREIRKKIRSKVFPRICVYRPERWVYPQTERR